MDLAPIQEILGENTPEISPTPLGRFRLVSALRNKFGDNYRNVPTAKTALDHFDKEHQYFKLLRKIRGGGPNA